MKSSPSTPEGRELCPLPPGQARPARAPRSCHRLHTDPRAHTLAPLPHRLKLEATPGEAWCAGPGSQGRPRLCRPGAKPGLAPLEETLQYRSGGGARGAEAMGASGNPEAPTPSQPRCGPRSALLWLLAARGGLGPEPAEPIHSVQETSRVFLTSPYFRDWKHNGHLFAPLSSCPRLGGGGSRGGGGPGRLSSPARPCPLELKGQSAFGPCGGRGPGPSTPPPH